MLRNTLHGLLMLPELVFRVGVQQSCVTDPLVQGALPWPHRVWNCAYLHYSYHCHFRYLHSFTSFHYCYHYYHGFYDFYYYYYYYTTTTVAARCCSLFLLLMLQLQQLVLPFYGFTIIQIFLFCFDFFSGPWIVICLPYVIRIIMHIINIFRQYFSWLLSACVRNNWNHEFLSSFSYVCFFSPTKPATPRADFAVCVSAHHLH